MKAGMVRFAFWAAAGLLVAACACSSARAGFVFDLADAVGGGNGTLPGVTPGGTIAAGSTYSSTPPNTYVNGTFVPNNTPGTIQITGYPHFYDFDSQTSAGYYNPWINGNNLDMDPSGGPLPNFNGDPNNHSLMAAHANKGITFDLQAVRTATGKVPNLFTTYAGDSRPKVSGTISYWVFVDGVLVANRNNVTNSEDALFIPLSPTARYLTLAISDSNDGIACDHGYFGDPFLRQATVWNGGGGDVNWTNGGNWVGGVAPASGTSTEVWITGDTNVGTTTPLNQNIANPFVLNRLEVTGTGMANAVNTGGQPLSFQADGTLLPTLHVSRNTAVTLSGNLNLADDTAITVDDGAAASDLTVSGQVTGSGTLTKYGQGTVTFNGVNGGFTGNVVVNAGTLILDRQNNPPLGINSNRTVTVNSGATLTATANGHNPFGTGTGPPLIIINGGTMNTSDYQHTTNLQMTGGTIQPTSAGTQADGLDMRGSPSLVTTLGSASQATIASKMTIRNAVTFDVADGTAATDLLISGQIVGAGGFTKTGTGTLTLTNTNTYTGGTTVSAGTLLVNNTAGSGVGTGDVTVGSGATLGGSGTIGLPTDASNVTVQSGGHLTPGKSPGILTIYGDLTLDAGSFLDAELAGTAAGTGYDQVDVHGGVSLADAKLDLSLLFVPALGDQFVLVNNDGTDAVGGTFAGLPEGAIVRSAFGGYDYPFAITYRGLTGNDVVLTAVPEPASVFLLGLGAAAWVFLCRRKK